MSRFRRLPSKRVPIGSDRFATLRSRAGSGARARALAALVTSAGLLTLALSGCGGGSHTASTAAADINGAAAGGASALTSSTTTSSTGTASAAKSGTGATGTTTTSSATTAAKGSGAGAAANTATGGGAVKSAPNDPAPSNGSSSAGKGDAHGKSKAAGRTAAGSGTAAAGSGAASGSSSGAGSSSGSSAPGANSGVPFEVETTSMEPTYQPETKIYYNPTSTHPQIGEVVVFYLPAGAEGGSCGEVMVGGRACTTPLPGMTQNKEISFKRVVGLPGDTIAIREGHVIRNGQPETPEPPIMACEKDEKLNCEFPTPITVPPNDYYLMADNRGLDREDSRIFGAVPQEYILGTVEGS